MKKLILVVLFLLCSGSFAGATVSLVTNESGIAATGFIDWAAVGQSVFPNTTNIYQPFNVPVTGVFGLSSDISIPSGTMQRVDQGYYSGWEGNFGTGEKLLWTDRNNGPMTLDFNRLVSGVGAQIQSAGIGSFIATIKAYGLDGTLLGSFSENGISSYKGDDSAIFIGISSDLVDINKVSFEVLYTGVTGYHNNDFCINGPLIKINSDPVPEPSTFILFGAGLSGLVFWRRKDKV
jgi:hypothetical protein